MVQIDSGRIQAMLDELHEIGARPNGGVFRGVYDAAWREAHRLIQGWMRQSGLDVRVDSVGNLWGELPGGTAGPPVVAGSHFDSVPNGGKFDGPLGVVGAVVAIDSLARQLGPPKRRLIAVATCEEEGSRFDCDFWASRAILGQTDSSEPARLRDHEGKLMADEMRASGLDPTRVAEAEAEPMAAFLELHIEQGPVLEKPRAEPTIGAVTAITGLTRLLITLTGQADHAGTAPMAGRRDTMIGVAEVALAVRERALAIGPPAAATVGHVDLTPNIGNVVPGRADFVVDARHPDRRTQESLVAFAIETAQASAARHGLACTIETIADQPPTVLDGRLVQMVRDAAIARGLPFQDIVAGAGHDAQLLGRAFPAAMIFVPSRGGRSHCPEEHSTAEDCAAGVGVLADVLRELAY